MCPVISPFSLLTSSSMTKALSRPLMLGAFLFTYTPRASPHLWHCRTSCRQQPSPWLSWHISQYLMIFLDKGNGNSPDMALITDLVSRACHLTHKHANATTPGNTWLTQRTLVQACHCHASHNSHPCFQPSELSLSAGVHTPSL